MNYFRIGSFKKYNSTLRTYYFTPSVHTIKKYDDFTTNSWLLKNVFRFGYVEDQLNNEDKDTFLDTLSLPDLFLDILKVLRNEMEPEKCLIQFCSDTSSNQKNQDSDYCSSIIADFEKFISDRQKYDVESDLKDLVKQILPGSVFTVNSINITGQDKVNTKIIRSFLVSSCSPHAFTNFQFWVLNFN